MSRKRKFLLLIHSLIFVTSILSYNDASAVSTSSPKSLTPEMVALLAMTTSDESKFIQNDAANIAAQSIRSEAPFAARVDGRVAILDNRNEPSQPVSPTRTQAQQLNLGISKSFDTGTATRLEYQSTKKELEGLPPTFESQDFESLLSISLRQSLWKNGFGRSVKIQRTANALSREAVGFSVVDRLESTALQGVSIFYRAWQAQLQGKAAEERVKLQQRLLNVTRIKTTRGTSEKADLLQVEAAVALSDERHQDAKKAATDFWNQLVIGLNLPESYLAMDAMTIPLSLGSILATGEKSCSSDFPESAARVQNLVRARDIADRSLELVRDSTNPELYLEIRAATNGLDDKWGKAFSETASAKHPQTSIALGIEMPLSHPKEEADRLDAVKQKTAMEIRLAQARTQYNIERDSLCRDLTRYKTKVKALKEIVAKQRAREKNEEERFRIGKTETLSVIMAGNDVTDAELGLGAAEGELHLTAWKLLYQVGQLTPYVEPFRAALDNL